MNSKKTIFHPLNQTNQKFKIFLLLIKLCQTKNQLHKKTSHQNPPQSIFCHLANQLLTQNHTRSKSHFTLKQNYTKNSTNS